MNPGTCSFSFIVLMLAALGGCSSEPVQESKKAGAGSDSIQGKVQVNIGESTADDAALSAGGPSVYLWEGTRRYRLFFNKPVTVDPGTVYTAEGVYAQKAIDDIGDPDQGKNGYPLVSSCERVVKTAWPGLPFDVSDAHASVLRARVKRYPARPIFLVTRLRPATASEKPGVAGEPAKDGESKDKDVPEVSVAGDKQRAFLIEGPSVQTAPLWEPAGRTVRCKLAIGPDGKVAELQTGIQLCEAVPWSQFRYQPPVQRGHPVKVLTEVEVRFDPRK